jgi:hypothetical protein
MAKLRLARPHIHRQLMKHKKMREKKTKRIENDAAKVVFIFLFLRGWLVYVDSVLD